MPDGERPEVTMRKRALPTWRVRPPTEMAAVTEQTTTNGNMLTPLAAPHMALGPGNLVRIYCTRNISPTHIITRLALTFVFVRFRCA